MKQVDQVSSSHHGTVVGYEADPFSANLMEVVIEKTFGANSNRRFLLVRIPIQPAGAVRLWRTTCRYCTTQKQQDQQSESE